MSVHRMERYTFGWSDPIAIYSGKTTPAPPTHKRRVLNEKGEMGIFENEYVHGAIDGDQQTATARGTFTGA